MPDDSRPRNSPKRVDQVLAEWQDNFGRILQRARAIERLNRRVSGLIGADLARHCQVANLRDGKLIFACTSPACAARLRMEAPELLAQLQAVGLTDIETIIVKMMPPA